MCKKIINEKRCTLDITKIKIHIYASKFNKKIYIFAKKLIKISNYAKN